MLHAAFTWMIFTALFLVVGLINPKWVLFWMKKPDRIWVGAITLFMVMGSVTLFGEANKRIREAQHSGAAPAAAAPAAPTVQP